MYFENTLVVDAMDFGDQISVGFCNEFLLNLPI